MVDKKQGKIQFLIFLLFFSQIILAKSSLTKAEELYQAAERGLLYKVQNLINSGVNVNARDKFSWTALHFAIRSRQTRIVKELIKKGANIEARDSHGRTPLHNAAYHSTEEIVGILLEAGANYKARTSSLGETVIDQAEKRDLPYNLESQWIQKMLKRWPKQILQAKKKTEQLKIAALITIKRGENTSLLRRLPPDLAKEIIKDILVTPKTSDLLLEKDYKRK